MQFVATAISCVSRDRLAPAGEEAHTRRVHKPRNEHPFRATNFSLLCSSPKSDRANYSSYRVRNPSNLVRGFHWREESWCILIQSTYNSIRRKSSEIFFSIAERYVLILFLESELEFLHENSRLHRLPSQVNAALRGSLRRCVLPPPRQIHAVHGVRCNLFQVCSSVYTVVLRRELLADNSVDAARLG